MRVHDALRFAVQFVAHVGHAGEMSSGVICTAPLKPFWAGGARPDHFDDLSGQRGRACRKRTGRVERHQDAPGLHDGVTGQAVLRLLQFGYGLRAFAAAQEVHSGEGGCAGANDSANPASASDTCAPSSHCA